MKKSIINQNQMGILVKNGCYVKVVMPGKYWLTSGKEIIAMPVDSEINLGMVRISDIKNDADFAAAAEVVEVPVGHIAVHMLDGFYHGVITSGNHAFWKAAGSHDFTVVDIRDYKLEGKLSEDIISSIVGDPSVSTQVEIVEEGNAGVLSVNGKYVETLDAGRHVFYVPQTKNVAEEDYDYYSCDKKSSPVKVAMVPVDIVECTIPYQEVLTLDKAEVRVNLNVWYRVTDTVKYGLDLDKSRNAFYNACKIALREAACNMTLDQLLESRTALGEKVYASLTDRKENIGIEVCEAGVMDMVLPGNIRDIMNTVLEAEKKAQASVITRREEVASTRSLLNTAKLLDENPTLYRLKEMECLERICSNVGSLNVGGGESLTRLLELLHK